MLNLSDKELDRFSKEAAQEYEPGDVLGEHSWERLQIRLDRDLGHASPNPFQHIRRFPFYYAPALLVLVGVSYYFVRHGVKGSGGPPGSNLKAPAVVVQNPLSSQSPVYPDKSTPASSTANFHDSAANAAGGSVAVGAGPGGSAAGGSAGAASAGSVASGGSARTGVAGSAAGGSSAAAGAARSGSVAGGSSAGTAGAASGVSAGMASASAASAASGGLTATGGLTASRGKRADLAGLRGSKGRRGRGARGNGNDLAGKGSRGTGSKDKSVNEADAHEFDLRGGGLRGVDAQGGNAQGGDVRGVDARGMDMAQQQAASRPKELGRASLLGLQSTRKSPSVDDSSLRAFTIKSTAPQLIRNRGMHINRNLQIGVVLAPDFASVNSLAGDRPGSTIGLTVDYQFANRWYIGSGLLLDRKNYAARGQDFHAPPNYFQNNGIHNDVELVKGSFEMLEIPLNLRYDFSVSGSTLFFATTGLSSYLFTSENNNYYYHMPFNFRQVCTPLSSPTSNYLFSSLNLSMGVETGLSNSLSLLIAPYMKVPVRKIGVGQVQMNTVGINFALKFAPVISRKRY